MKKIVAVIILVWSIFKVNAQDTVRISDYGYKPGSRQNAVPFVIKALADCKTKQKPVLVFPKGRYDFWPQHSPQKLYYESNTTFIPLRTCPILIEGFSQLQVEGEGSDFIFHDRMQPFTIDSSSNVSIYGVNIDWDIPLSAQAEIKLVTDDYIELAINAYESPYVIENDKLVFVGEGWKSGFWGVMEFDRNTKLIVPQSGDNSLGSGAMNYKATEVQRGLVRLHYPFKRKPAVGNFLVLRHNERDHAGIFITNSNNILLESINMYQNAGLGILAQYSQNISLKNINSVPNSNKGRIFSGHDDGLQVSNCRGQITVDNCRFQALMDDPINVHGTSIRIIKKIDAKKLACRFVHHQSIGFTWARPGEAVGFIENDAMNTIGTGVVESFVPKSPEEFEISFKESIPGSIEAGDALENLTWVPDLLVKNSYFGSNRARGILISTPGKIIIENNVFESSGTAILVAGDANYWYESGAVKDVTIRNNVFKDPCLTSLYQFCEGIISIYPEIPKPDPAKPFHRNITIENNEFNPFDYPVLYAKSTEGLSFSNNTIRRSTRFESFHNRKYMITLEACKKVNIQGNILTGDVLGKNIRLISTSSKEVKLRKRQGIEFVK